MQYRNDSGEAIECDCCGEEIQEGGTFHKTCEGITCVFCKEDMEDRNEEDSDF